MTVLMIGIVGWLLLAVFVCALGRAAKAADERELERLAAGRGGAFRGVSAAGAAALSSRRAEARLRS